MVDKLFKKMGDIYADFKQLYLVSERSAAFRFEHILSTFGSKLHQPYKSFPFKTM